MVHGFSIIIPGRVDLFEKSRPRKCAINPRSEEKWIIRQLRLGVNPLSLATPFHVFTAPPTLKQLSLFTSPFVFRRARIINNDKPKNFPRITHSVVVEMILKLKSWKMMCT